MQPQEGTHAGPERQGPEATCPSFPGVLVHTMLPTGTGMTLSNGSTEDGNGSGLSPLATTRTRPADTEADRADAAAAAGGDLLAFERIYGRHVARIHSLCRRMIGDHEADDACQEVFLRAWRKIGHFRGESAFGTWLYRLAVNLILGRRETVGRREGRFVGRDPADMPLAAPRARPDLRVDFETAIARLPDGARKVFVLHDIEGYTHEEIAAAMGVTTGTTKSQLHRARMTLRRHLD